MQGLARACCHCLPNTTKKLLDSSGRNPLYSNDVSDIASGRRPPAGSGNNPDSAPSTVEPSLLGYRLAT